MQLAPYSRCYPRSTSIASMFSTVNARISTSIKIFFAAFYFLLQFPFLEWGYGESNQTFSLNADADGRAQIMRIARNVAKHTAGKTVHIGRISQKKNTSA
ncbi:hypothetical protein [Glaciimonas immobilis]|uniref:Uncharacterized protein n=1 Tax=Glaciimonas immobilis TaxID=728004 RepID=A0A840RKG3_9BURK|nr:hypothetical protein [Glaciimonas immobilis]KAF3999245.1 hypothetical protein HAV38_04730 [Glaciimonas immobilis]MBB5198707.1 hypothetical protein [Glaciimonas immobilis]